MESVESIIFWAVLAAVAFVGELLSVSFFLLFFSVGAVVALVMAFLGLGVALQAAGFIAAWLLSMVVLRPAIMHRISFRASERYESHDSITGKSGVVSSAIEPGSSGTVRIGSGKFWTARALYPEPLKNHWSNSFLAQASYRHLVINLGGAFAPAPVQLVETSLRQWHGRSLGPCAAGTP